MKLRVNRILNASGHAGPTIGNRACVIGLLYTGMECGMVKARDVDDIINSAVAGLATTTLYKEAVGPKSVVVAGSIGGIAVGLVVTRKRILKRYVPI
ncbi:unnamed protein product [Lactuca virosa]|uniref:Uncharacterized protein n=1 Tax=Lactuca virosa TaxID=75947 RepID=A0AAU9PKE1_9ASTR|nr:unnamed protein product [Lactuca virosa]